MKKIFIITLLLVLIYLPINKISALNEATPSGELLKTKQIEDLKERLATKVAQMRQLEKRAVFGTVKTTSITTLTVETSTKDLKIELTDDINVYQMIKGKRTPLKTDDIDKGDTVSVFGDYDTTLDVLNAQIIIIQNQLPVRISGIIKSADSGEYTVTVTTADNLEYTVDYETTTKAFEWSETQNAGKAGFSKLITGDFISVLGYPVPKKDNRISATRILVYNPNPPATPSPKNPSPSISTASPTIKPTKTTPPSKITPAE